MKKKITMLECCSNFFSFQTLKISKQNQLRDTGLWRKGTVYKDLTSVNVRTRDDEERLPEPIYVPTEGEARERLENSPIKQLSDK